MKKIIIGVMIVISFVFVLKISCVQAQNIMGDETSQEENCEQLNWTLENGILIISGQGKIPMDFLKIIQLIQTNRKTDYKKRNNRN